jgi:hypothetical protein
LLPDIAAQFRAMQDKVQVGSMPALDYWGWVSHPAFQKWISKHAIAIGEWTSYRDAA